MFEAKTIMEMKIIAHWKRVAAFAYRDWAINWPKNCFKKWRSSKTRMCFWKQIFSKVITDFRFQQTDTFLALLADFVYIEKILSIRPEDICLDTDWIEKTIRCFALFYSIFLFALLFESIALFKRRKFFIFLFNIY